MADTLQDHRQVGSPRQLTVQYDSTVPDGSQLGRWVKVTSGPCDINGAVDGDWPSSGVWQQT